MGRAPGIPRLVVGLVKRRPAPRDAPPQSWLRLLQDPKSARAGIAADPRQNFECASLNAGFQQLSRRDPPTAQAVLAQLDRKRLSEAQYGELRRAVALGLAWDRDPASITAFQAVPAAAVDDLTREWRVRAALWAGDWQRGAAWVQKMPAALARDPRWQ